MTPAPDSEKKDGSKARQAPVSWQRELFESIRSILAVVMVLLLCRVFLFEPFTIPSGSMIPTLQVGDYILVSKYSYGYSRFSFPFSPDLFSGRIPDRKPERGDVAVFRFTKDTSIDYVKRIVGLPGDRIQVREGHLFLNGKEVSCRPEKPYEAVDENMNRVESDRCEENLPSAAASVHYDILKTTSEGMANNTREYIVPPGYFFAMGDNRDNSRDSRFMSDDPGDLGFVPIENLVGRAEIVFFSLQPTHPRWQFWYWPLEIRWNRFFHVIR